jgi:adenosine kinase
MEGVVFGLCNPLLDISAEVDPNFLNKYGLAPANAILAAETHLPMYGELAALPHVEYIAGGAGQNTMRVCQWMLQHPLATSYVGCVGKDEFGDRLENAARGDGVNVLYMKSESASTGTCAVCVVGKERSLVANLGAANHFSHEHLDAPEVQTAMDKARIFYVTGFILTVSPTAALQIAKTAMQQNKVFCINFSAPFILQFFGQHVADLMPYVDFLFCNESEAQAFAETKGISKDDLEAVAKYVANLEKANNARPRTVVFTQGSQQTIVAVQGQDAVQRFDVPAIEASKIVDTNGAGDAFVGGFLARLAQGKSIKEAVEAGHYAAGVVIQRSGCTFPPKPEAEWLQ